MITAQQRCSVKCITYFSHVPVYKVRFCPDLHKSSITKLTFCPHSYQAMPQMIIFSISWKNTQSQGHDWKPSGTRGSLLWLQWAWNQALHNCEISIRYLATHEYALWYTLHLYFLTVKLVHFTYLLYICQKMMLLHQMGEIWVVGMLEVMEMEAK